MSSKASSKSKDSFESWESLFRKTLSKDRQLNFTKPLENPIQWIHLLDPFDHQETRTAFKSTSSREGLTGESSPKTSQNSGDKIPQLKFPEAVVALAQAAAKASGESRGAGSMDPSGWPLLPFSKVQLYKCEKCCLEFCSPVNHRRHLRVIHRRTVHTDKEDLMSQRQQLATFWDALSPEEAIKIVDAKNLVLEDLVGEKVARALSHLLQQPALFALPHSYVKSGAMLLDLVQRRSSKALLTSSELFRILDGSSEKTFPSFGLNAMQRYVFEGGAGKVGLEAKNLVSALGFLVELNLVKAFIKDKDVEAQRCQTALVEEEEASQRKRAQIQERKRMKKARQKDLKEKEQKSFDSTRACLSPGSESSDDEDLSNANLVVGYDQQSRPSSNAYENLYHRLAGEESDSDLHLKVVPTPMQGPAENYQVPGDEADDSYLHSEAVSIALQENPVHGSTANVDTVGLEQEVECADTVSSNKSNMPDTLGVRKMLFKEKRKYPAERSPEARREFFVPVEKSPWKEKHHLSFRKFFRQPVINSVKEGMHLAGPDVVVEESSMNKVGGYRPRQLMCKPERTRKYAGTTIWTKKAPKHSDTKCEMAPVQAFLADGTSMNVSDHAESVEVPEIRPDVASVDSLHETVSTSIDSPLPTPGSCGLTEQSTVAMKDGSVCSLAGQSSVGLAPDLGHSNELDQAGYTSSSLSSGMVGSVVIGSVRVSLVGCKVGLDQRVLPSNTFQYEAEGRKMHEASEEEPTGSAHSSAKVEESLRALNEIGAVNCVPRKDLERTGKGSKLPSHMDSEEKENHEHPPYVSGAGEGKLRRLAVVQAGSKGGGVKVWRPVLSTSHESQDRLGSAGSAATSVVANESSVFEPGKDSTNRKSVDPEELKQVQRTLESSTVSCAPDTIPVIKYLKMENNVVEEFMISASTFEVVRNFLSQRWSAVVNSSETVVLHLEEEEECESQNKGLCEDTLHVKDLRSPPLQANKDASSFFPGNGKVMHGLKQGCSGSAMAASGRLSGKRNNFHIAPRFRYVPK